MPAYPGVDQSFARLRRSGWSVGEAAFGGGGRLVWQAEGQNGENQIRAEGPRPSCRHDKMPASFGLSDRLWVRKSP